MLPGRLLITWIATSSVVLALACMPKTKVVPLRREDPRVLEMIGAKEGWLHETGATRAVRALWQALRARDYSATVERLGPMTRRVLATDAGVSVLSASDLRRVLVQSEGREGAVELLRRLSQVTNPTFRERAPFDPTKRKAQVLVLGPRGKDQLTLAAVFTDSGWKVELVSPSRRFGGGSVERR